MAVFEIQVELSSLVGMPGLRTATKEIFNLLQITFYAEGQPSIALFQEFLPFRLVFGQVKVADDFNEITAIPQLLKVLTLKGCIATIDAIDTQKEIAREVRKERADYVLALKDNQGLLFEGVVESLQEGLATNFKDIAHDYSETVEKDHGRIETANIEPYSTRII